LRPDAIDAANCPNLRGLRARSASSMRARTVMPSITLPCHMSMFHSVPPTRHGITSNTWAPMARPIPGLIDAAHGFGRRAAMFFNWETLRDLARPEKQAFSFFTFHDHDPQSDQVVADAAAVWIPRQSLDFAFVYLGMVDEMGHRHGWMNDGYLRQVETTDVALGTVLAALPKDGHVLLQSDHGGHDRSHGTELDADMLIPWMLSGPGIRGGHALEAPISILDTAPTLARLLEVDSPRDWEGWAVKEAWIAEG
jgi:predicted AlkP superfamily pyrophosphatase or phosphodiesterase